MNSLFLLYGFSSRQEYTIYTVFEPNGHFSNEAMLSYLQDEKGHKLNPVDYPYAGGFKSFDELKECAFELCRDRRADRIVLVSQEDFNLGLEEHSHPDEFFNRLSNLGESLENLEEEGNKGLLKKLFR
jgi:hypothetical protein